MPRKKKKLPIDCGTYHVKHGKRATIEAGIEMYSYSVGCVSNDGNWHGYHIFRDDIRVENQFAPLNAKGAAHYLAYYLNGGNDTVEQFAVLQGFAFIGVRFEFEEFIETKEEYLARMRLKEN